MRGRDSLSLEMTGLNKDHGEKNKTSESVIAFAIMGHRKGWHRERFLTSLSPESGKRIKRFILCWN